jgi:hypothetical protein
MGSRIRGPENEGKVTRPPDGSIAHHEEESPLRWRKSGDHAARKLAQPCRALLLGLKA